MVSSENRVALITGASSGIGRAIALALASQNMELCLLGRNIDSLEEVADIARSTSPKVLTYCADLTVDATIHELKVKLEQTFDRIDLLIHSAGLTLMGTFETASIADFDRQYQVNVRVPYLLTQTLLPWLVASQGQVVFINSSVIQRTRAEVGQYAATKHALKAIADCLRAEVNAKQVSVLSVYPGRTATPQQSLLHEQEGRVYQPEQLLQPEDVAKTILSALALPRTAEVTDIYIRPFTVY